MSRQTKTRSPQARVAGSAAAPPSLRAAIPGPRAPAPHGEARRRLRRQLSSPPGSTGDVAETVETDLGLVVAVLGAVSEQGTKLNRIWSVPDAVEVVTPAGVRAAADGVESYEFGDANGEWQGQLEPLRLHSVMTRQAAGLSPSTVRTTCMTPLASWARSTVLRRS